MKKTDKELLFERMHSVGGMPINKDIIAKKYTNEGVYRNGVYYDDNNKPIHPAKKDKNWTGVDNEKYQKAYNDWRKNNKIKEHEIDPETIKDAAEDYPERDESPSYQVKLDNITRCAAQLHDMIEDFDQLPAWVQDKITIAEHNMKAIKDWIKTLGHEEDEHGELVDENPMGDYDISDDEMNETQNLMEKNVPNDPSKWSYAKSQAKKKFDVYPSAYANAWASKKYKELGGTWRKKKD